MPFNNDWNDVRATAAQNELSFELQQHQVALVQR